MMLAEEVRKRIKGEMYEDEATLKKFSRDASIFEIKPALVVAPKDANDIKALVKFVTEAKQRNEQVSLTPRSAGTCMSGGTLTESISVDMIAHFNQIKNIEIFSGGQGGYGVVEPGVYYRDFDLETRRRNVIMPTYPASRELASVGGMVANNAGGEKTLTYGKIERFVLQLKVVLSDGQEYVIKPLGKEELALKMQEVSFEGRLYQQMYNLITQNQALIMRARPQVSKNSAGYYLWNVWDGQTFDLNKLIVGSQGTLGIITEITFALVPVKPVSKLAVIFLKKLDHLGELIVALKNLKPESLESYDDRTLRLAIHFFKDLIKILKPKNFFSMAWAFLPEVWLILTKGMPKLVVLAEFEGATEAEVDARLKQVPAAIAPLGLKTHITKTREEANEYWVVRRESFNLLRHKIKDKQTAPFIDDFAVPSEVLPEFLPKLNQILGKYNLIYTIAGHPGDGNFHIIPLMNLSDMSQRAIIPKLSDEVYNLVLQYKGTITAEHNDGLIRTPYLEKMYGSDVIKLFEQTKQIFDPLNIFNPGKKVGGNLGYAMAHIKKS
jgi:FAD/FMN-containing dehydrogenase